MSLTRAFKKNPNRLASRFGNGTASGAGCRRACDPWPEPPQAQTDDQKIAGRAIVNQIARGARLYAEQLYQGVKLLGLPRPLLN